VYIRDRLAGVITEDDDGYAFRYLTDWIHSEHAEPVSLTMPLTEKTYTSGTLFPFFDGLIPEGWLLDIAERSWKLDRRDRMGLLLTCCRDCIGAVSVIEMTETTPEEV
jgi:serine/threonine-protein kinase HipA